MKYKMSYINKLAKNIDKVVGEEIRLKILKGCEDLTAKQKKEKRAEIMKMVTERMDNLLYEKDIIKIREACACKPQKFLKKAKELNREAKNIEDFLYKLQETGYAGNSIRLEKNIIHGKFGIGKCVCGMVGDTKSLISISWCHCCKAHIRWLYEKSLKRSLKVEITESIISGGKDCIYKIYLK
ncbi:MAG: hypothetical protein FH751_16580 [Firmicutes bacterium]|nr:hypothetical protein [Bacillota bacterium]